MQRTRAVQVVLGEGRPGILRLVLEAQGFHVVGHARGDDELKRILEVTHPNVVVLDAGISAIAMREAQVGSDYAPIVVVWPKDAFTAVAEERVDPATAILELGNAVRRVVDRRVVPIGVAERSADPSPTERAEPVPNRTARRGAGGGRHALVVVAAWTIALTALAAIGLAVPSALRGLEPTTTLHPSLDRPERALTADREGQGLSPARADERPSCADAARGRGGRHPSRGKPEAPGRGCASGRGERQGGGGNGHGRPDDPGKGSGHGKGHGRPNDGGSGKGSTKKDGAGSLEETDDRGSSGSDDGGGSGLGGSKRDTGRTESPGGSGVGAARGSDGRNG